MRDGKRYVPVIMFLGFSPRFEVSKWKLGKLVEPYNIKYYILMMSYELASTLESQGTPAG